MLDLQDSPKKNFLGGSLGWSAVRFVGRGLTDDMQYRNDLRFPFCAQKFAIDRGVTYNLRNPLKPLEALANCTPTSFMST